MLEIYGWTMELLFCRGSLGRANQRVWTRLSNKGPGLVVKALVFFSLQFRAFHHYFWGIIYLVYSRVIGSSRRAKLNLYFCVHQVITLYTKWRYLAMNTMLSPPFSDPTPINARQNSPYSAAPLAGLPPQLPTALSTLLR